MKLKKEITTALKELEIRRQSYQLDMIEMIPSGVKYNTELIRNLEVVDAQIHTLKWVLQKRKKEGGK